MKTTIITTAVAIFLSITNVFGSNKLYKNIVGNKETGTITATVCEGSNEGNLTPLKQTVFHYNSDRSLKERASYKWNANTKEWVAIGLHKYEYNSGGKLLTMSYMGWNETTKAWHQDIQYAMYIYDINNEDLSVEYLSVNAN